MKLKEQTFAVIAEKKGSISHEFFNKLSKNSVWWTIGDYYIWRQEGRWGTHTKNFILTDIPIYTESEFEELIKQEELENKLENSVSKGNIGTIFNCGELPEPQEAIVSTSGFINFTVSKKYAEKLIREDLTKQGVKIGEETKIEIV